MNQPDRVIFNTELAGPLADRAGLDGAGVAGCSKRFTYRSSDDTYTVIAGPSEARTCDLALAYGLREAADRRLQLILPAAHAGATLHRAAWLRPERRPHIWVYANPLQDTPVRTRSLPRQLSKEHHAAWVPEGDLAAEFRKATTPYRLPGARAGWVAPLIDWVAAHDELDPAHRRSERAWHCRGQKVLRIVSASGSALRVTAGIQDANTPPIELTDPITSSQLTTMQGQIEQAITTRLTGARCQPDEHWLQAVLRRQPHLVGLEERAIREVPAWRRLGGLEPQPQKGAWGRGYIDLLGLDAHGTIQIVETKLAANDDALFVLQGLDYLAYCEAYRAPVTALLGVNPRTPFAIKYLLGAPKESNLKLSRFAPAQFDALADDITWSFHTMTGWHPGPNRKAFGTVKALGAAGLMKLASKGGTPTESDEEAATTEEA